MADFEWFKMLAAALGGGLTVKILDIAYLELRRKDEKSQSATKFVDQHLDPLLKAADELVGKLHSLGKEDFKTFAALGTGDPLAHADCSSTAFLLARFWAQVEILREQALYVTISEDERGRRLQSFLDCLESRGVRLLDRISQRAIGETLIASSGSSTIRFIDFIKSAGDPDMARWLAPLMAILRKAPHTSERQLLLQYGAVLHAMIDTLDGDHSVTRDRPAIPNKLSKRTWRDLKYRVFGTYLRFVKDQPKYIGRPKTRTAAGDRR